MHYRKWELISLIKQFIEQKDSDLAGRDLMTMKEELSTKLDRIARGVRNPDTKKLIKSFIPTDDIKFPEGRVSLKTHKPGVTQTHCAVRPIVSNVKSPTAALASYLGSA